MPHRTSGSRSTSFVLAAGLTLGAACTEGAGPPGQPPVGTPSALARCADPAVALTTRWEVDNLHDPITSIARTGTTVVVASADGALKIWETGAGGAAERRPTYGDPIVQAGVALSAIAAGAEATVASVDVEGRARLWSAGGAELRAPMALLAGAGALIAFDEQRRWLVGGTAGFAGELAIADLASGAVHAPVATQLWHATAAQLTGDRWITAGDWYNCPAIDVRAPSAPDAELAYWDNCRSDTGTDAEGWFRALAVDASGTELLAAGDQLLATFALASVAGGPTAIAATDVRIDRVGRLDGDRLAISFATRGEVSELTWWSLADLTARRTATIAAAVDVAIDPELGLIVAASADGILRGYTCD